MLISLGRYPRYFMQSESLLRHDATPRPEKTQKSILKPVGLRMP